MTAQNTSRGKRFTMAKSLKSGAGLEIRTHRPSVYKTRCMKEGFCDWPERCSIESKVCFRYIPAQPAPDAPGKRSCDVTKSGTTNGERE